MINNKNISFLSLLTFCFINAQVGVSTSLPSSTLDVRGAIEGNFQEITGTTTLGANSYHVSFTGVANSILNLPTQSLSDDSASDFRGRKYYIKNNSTASSITLTAASGQFIRFGGGIPNANTYVIKPGAYITITASGSGWDLDLVASGKGKNWILYDTSLDGYINGASSQSIPANPTGLNGPYYTLVKPNDGNAEVMVTVTVPPTTQYSTSRVVISFVGWGDAFNTGAAQGSLRFIINESTSTNTAGTDTNTVMMQSWSAVNTATNGIRFNFPLNYVLTNKAPGTYTYKVKVHREEESGTIAANGVRIWTVQAKADVYVKE